MRALVATIFAAFVCSGINFGQNARWQYSTRNRLPQAIVADQKDQRYLYIAQKSGGLLVLDSGRLNTTPKKIAQIGRNQFRRLDAMNLVQHKRYLFIALGSFFGRNSKAGLAIVDIKDPRKPKLAAIWTSKKRIQGSAVVGVKGNYAFLGAMREGVYIFDVSDRRRIREVSRANLDIHFPKPNPGKIGHPNARGLAVRGDLLYVTNDAGGLRIVDISNKRNPREISKYILRRRGLKQQAYNNIAINFPYAYIALDYCGMEIVNIRNPRNIFHVGWWNPWRCNSGSNNWFNSPGHTNQIHFDKRTEQVFMSAGDSELQVIDVSNPRRPRLSKSFGGPRNRLGTWGLGVTDDTIYLAYIRTFVPFRGNWSGVKAVSRKRP